MNGLNRVVELVLAWVTGHLLSMNNKLMTEIGHLLSMNSKLITEIGHLLSMNNKLLMTEIRFVDFVDPKY